jgi:2-oxo-3-hexenedioate decarboxylase
VAAELAAAAEQLRPVPAFSVRGEPFSIAEAYDVQWLVVEQRLRRGEKLVGVKVGLTSEAKQRQLGLHEPVYGWLTDAMVMRSPARVDLRRQIHPRVEPEIGFRLGDGLQIEAVFPAFEMVDSRYEGFKFGMADVIADNTSAAGVIVGNDFSTALDLPAVRCSLRVNGAEVATATGADVLGDPKRALDWVSEQIKGAGRPIEAGMIVLSGGMTDFVALHPGDVVEAVFGDLGAVSVSASN